ncbi:hypothetical protein [Desulfopila inferna]|uniref:hypothetical protein n=1 Tax=Desulfopila inferna TaxID=468528 RepID=UPI001966A72E|nr:hypothetical protein [Desulfopila inferna]MBM9603728.1 hypothetical protein [Desulfopila inferna]
MLRSENERDGQGEKGKISQRKSTLSSLVYGTGFTLNISENGHGLTNPAELDSLQYTLEGYWNLLTDYFLAKKKTRKQSVRY